MPEFVPRPETEAAWRISQNVTAPTEEVAPMITQINLTCHCGKTYGTERGLLQHQRLSHKSATGVGPLVTGTDSGNTRIEPSNVGRDAGPMPAHSCKYCDMAFDTASGLGQHMRHMHPLESNAERLVTLSKTSRARWSNEDTEKLMQHFYDLSSTGLNRNECADNDEETWRNAIPEYILGTLSSGERKGLEIVSIESLLEITVRVQTGNTHKDEARSALSALVDKAFPSKWKNGTEKRRPVSKPPRTERQKKNARYKALQRLLRLRQKDGAECVLDGSWKD
ncbi:hypothetical protein Btru_072982 [Bulinus truncatus]|nr:hypothetical protein Btru_072982 [Bulinus truncatus]